MKKTDNLFLLTLSFIEGGSVMACELIGAKLLAPFFGTSLYVWAAALALTLGGLTVGYFFGGRLSKKYNGSKKVLFYILIIAAALLAIMPFTSDLIMARTIDFSLEGGAITSLFIFMFPPLVFMGMVSPVIINLLTTEADSAGNSAGTVYAISTLGGILYTFLMGFYIIPNFGLKMPAVISGIVLGILPLISLFKLRDAKALPLILVLVVFSGLGLSTKNNFNEEYNILYQSEGILGQVKVVDHPSYEITEDNRIGRGLIVNNTLQTYIGLENDLQYSIWSWAQYFPTAASVFPKGSKVLLLGLGGGTIVKQLNRLGFEVEVVEIDRRIWEVSLDFFNLDPKTVVHVDDARHFIKTADKKYDIVIFDTFLSESVPEHLLTIEGFEDVRKILNPNGMIMSNFYGFIDGKRGRAARSVYKTFEASGFNVDILATPGAEASRNLIFLASEADIDFSKTNYNEPNFEKIESLYDHFIDRRMLNLSDAYLLSDKRPRLSKLYNKAATEWKKSYNEYYRKYFLKK